MLAEVLLDTGIHVHYRFLDLAPADDEAGGRDDATRGQANGLCGAAVPGRLTMVTGLHTGDVHVRLELHDTAPELGDEWADAVEVIYATTSDDLWLSAFDSSEGPVDLPPGIYRARYCARGFAAAHDLDTNMGDEPVDHYLLQFWPLTGADRILRTGGPSAEYWHAKGHEPAWTAEELRERVQELRTRRAERQEREELESWHEQDDELDELDGDLAAALAGASPALHRSVTAWAVERVLENCGLAGESWVPGALTALRQGTFLPPRALVERSLPPMPQPDRNDAWSLVGGDTILVAAGDLGDEGAEALQQALDRRNAVETLYRAGDPDTLTAARLSLAAAALDADDSDEFFARARERFPELWR
ncbi:hypothetical protein [Actinoplanes sp. RD1]|uniref:hypothetical protein n=1 Tax=Actinoplanes sp. RD1 TaxID=3064538 RepID=UPI0027421F26|nr:hypothetical protein [Actinoplanes sp. RD1]